MYTHILIPTDGSDLAQHGVDHGLALAKALGSKVTILTATQPMAIPSVGMVESWVGSSSDFAKYDDSRRKLADSILSAAKASAEKMDIDVTIVYTPDALPAIAIVGAAEERGCDLIVMASHGRRGIKRALLGSQTSEVLALTKIPVLVVK
jgi:nucleotide-binding universal stress UspA family protein